MVVPVRAGQGRVVVVVVVVVVEVVVVGGGEQNGSSSEAGGLDATVALSGSEPGAVQLISNST